MDFDNFYTLHIYITLGEIFLSMLFFSFIFSFLQFKKQGKLS
jgi:hypothetical protein